MQGRCPHCAAGCERCRDGFVPIDLARLLEGIGVERDDTADGSAEDLPINASSAERELGECLEDMRQAETDG